MIATGNHYDANSLRAHRPLGIVLWSDKFTFIKSRMGGHPDTQTDETGIVSPASNSIDNNQQAAGRRGQCVRQPVGFDTPLGTARYRSLVR